MIKLVCDLRQVGDFLWVLLFPPPIKLTDTIAEILLKVELTYYSPIPNIMFKYIFQVIWMVTFLTSTILDADIGIGISLVFSILTVSLRTQR